MVQNQMPKNNNDREKVYSLLREVDDYLSFEKVGIAPGSEMHKRIKEALMITARNVNKED